MGARVGPAGGGLRHRGAQGDIAVDGYAVIDVETTGFSPQQNDRVVEIGVVYVSPRGEIQDHWSTIVNPRRDVGPTHVHGLTATDVSTAPTFDEIAKPFHCPCP